MPTTEIRQVRGDQRTAELADKNVVEIVPPPEEIAEWAERNLIYIYNVSPYVYRYEHPLVGILTIKACKPGEPYSEPTVIKGMIPYGVRVEMRQAELRHESGRKFCLDVLQIGNFMDRKKSLLNCGVFIAAEDTFDPDNVQEWVKRGKCGKTPTKGELEKANAALAAWDFRLIAEADGHWDEGAPNKQAGTGTDNIGPKHREALRRRNQTRPWDQPLQTMIDCPGCGTKVPPTIVRHTCGAVFDWERAIQLGLVTPEQYEAQKAASKKK